MTTPLPAVIVPDRYTYITAFLTMRCNLNCGFCVNAIGGGLDRRGFREISGAEWVGALNRLVTRPDVPVTLTGGEPFLHESFIDIINQAKPELSIDILTNLQWGPRGVDTFIDRVDPRRLERHAPYASMRVSYHPEHMGDGEDLLAGVKRLQEAGFRVAVYAILYPSPAQMSGINQMQFRCRDAGIDFRVKEYMGRFDGQLYGDYSHYPDSVFQSDTRTCSCRIAELLIATDGAVYRCHRDLYHADRPVGYLLDPQFRIDDVFRPCHHYGLCHPCDVKTKTDHKQQFGYTSVEIRNIG